jgi:hypothetical protein
MADIVFCYARPATSRFITHEAKHGVLQHMVIFYSLWRAVSASWKSAALHVRNQKP